MFHTHLGAVLQDWARVAAYYGPAIRFAAVASGLYIAWSFAFEAWFEPVLRRCWGAVIGQRIVWVRAAGPFRVWGLSDGTSPAKEGGIGFLGAVAVLSAALVPTIGVDGVSVALAADRATAASGYLMSLPMMALFVVRMLSVK